MVTVTALWLPILMSAVAVFIISSVIHMAVRYHKNDYRKLANEDAVLAALRQTGVTPGEYMFPACTSMKDMASPEMVAKRKLGPIGTLVVMRGDIAMGRSLGQWFGFCLVVAFGVAYLTGRALGPGAQTSEVFRFAGAAAVLVHAMSNVHNSIWKGVAWSTTFKFVFDGILYGLATGAVFAWMWPASS